MYKENLETGAKFYGSTKHKAPTWLGRVLALALIAFALNEKYHKKDSFDNTPVEPKNFLFLENPQEVHYRVLSWEQEKQKVKIIEKQNPAEEEKINVLTKIRVHPEIFSERDRQDIEMYYPIYAAAGEKFNIPWYLLWIIHKAESTVSANPAAFEPGRPHYGAMGRAVKFHFQENVDFASRGLEYLQDLQQRYPDDWAEIAWAAMKLREDWDSTGSLSGALNRYTIVAGSTYYQTFLFYHQIFD